MDTLLIKNDELKDKMFTLLDLTKSVLQKIKIQEQNNFTEQQEYDIMRDLDE